MITRIRRLLARIIALLVVLFTFGLVKVQWSGGTVEEARENEGRAAIMTTLEDSHDD